MGTRNGADHGQRRGTAFFEEAEAILDQAQAVVDRQKVIYRFPFQEIAADRPSYTSYPFGYLRTVHDLWYWRREWKMATDPAGFNFWPTLYDLPSSSGL